MSRPALFLYAALRLKTKKHNLFIPIVLPLFLLLSLISFAEDTAWLFERIPFLRAAIEKTEMRPSEFMRMTRKLLRLILQCTDLDIDILAERKDESGYLVVKMI